MNNGILAQALKDFLSSEEYKKIKKQERKNHKELVEKFLKKCKPAIDQTSHKPNKEIEEK